MGGGTIFKVWVAQVHANKTIEFLWFELASVASQALKYDVINYTIWKSKLHYFTQKFHHYETVSVNHLKLNRLLQDQLQVNRVTRAHRTIYTDWINCSRLASLKFAFILAGTIVALWR